LSSVWELSPKTNQENCYLGFYLNDSTRFSSCRRQREKETELDRDFLHLSRYVELSYYSLVFQLIIAILE
jgi:hypothetical protein